MEVTEPQFLWAEKEISSEHWIVKIGLHISDRHAATEIKMSFWAAMSFTTHFLEQSRSITQNLGGI